MGGAGGGRGGVCVSKIVQNYVTSFMEDDPSPYILGYKSINFGQFLDIIFSIRLTRESVTSKYHISDFKNSFQLICGF